MTTKSKPKFALYSHTLLHCHPSCSLKIPPILLCQSQAQRARPPSSIVTSHNRKMSIGTAPCDAPIWIIQMSTQLRPLDLTLCSVVLSYLPKVPDTRIKHQKPSNYYRRLAAEHWHRLCFNCAPEIGATELRSSILLPTKVLMVA